MVIEWRSPPGFSAYEVSEYGAVRRKVTSVTGMYLKGYLLKPRIIVGGYVSFEVTDDNGISDYVGSHRLVALAWHGEPTELKPFALHKDDVKLHNHYSNIYWGDTLDNRNDAIRNGRVPEKVDGWDMTNAQFTKDQINQIRDEYKNGPYELGYHTLAKKWGCSADKMADILRNKTYKDPTYTKHSKSKRFVPQSR